MVTRVAVAGASGYAGGETLRLLAGHPEVEIGAVTAHSNAGTLLGEHQPHLRSLADRVLLPTAVEHLVGHDVVVPALPHGASGEIAAQLPEGVLVLDLGADHRLESAADWSAFYGSEHAGTWPYGLPELLLTVAPGAAATETKQRERLVGARRVAVPGCNVTAVTLGIQPGVAAGLVEGTDLVAVLANGYSGAGKSLKPHLLASEALGSAQPYAVGGAPTHPGDRTEPAGRGAPAVSISFTPTLVPMSRGILATVTARLSDDAARLDPPRSTRASARPGRTRTSASRSSGCCPRAVADDGDDLGANTALVQVAVDHAAGRVVTVTAIDNLVKGTAGAAVQSMNIALGLPQTAGLTTEGSPVTVTTPQGFRAAGVAAGLKSTGARDVALVVNDGPLDVAAAVLTTNRVFAAPVAWTRQAVGDGARRPSCSTRAARTRARARRASPTRTGPRSTSPTCSRRRRATCSSARRASSACGCPWRSSSPASTPPRRRSRTRSPRSTAAVTPRSRS